MWGFRLRISRTSLDFSDPQAVDTYRDSGRLCFLRSKFRKQNRKKPCFQEAQHRTCSNWSASSLAAGHLILRLCHVILRRNLQQPPPPPKKKKNKKKHQNTDMLAKAFGSFGGFNKRACLPLPSAKQGLGWTVHIGSGPYVWG